MKRYIHYIALLAAFLVGATACESESMPAAFPGDYSFSLNTNTRATTDGKTPQENGVDDFNENQLDFVYLFFFDGSTLKYKTKKLPVDTSQKVSFSVTRQELTRKAPYTVYALANRELDDDAWNSIESIADLNALSVPAISVENDGKQSSFVMSGQASITSLTNGDNGSINLYRSAAKISLVLDVVDQIVVGTGENAITYVPELTSMQVTLYKGAKNGIVDGIATFAELTETTRDISKKQVVEGVSVASHVPFYSYPTSWVNDEDNECYLELMIIWKNVKSGVFAPYYYRIPVNKDTKELLRNHHYKISTEVARLGSLKESDAKELTATFDIKIWNECSLYPNLKKYSYLWVEDTDIIMNNSNQITINFASSSDVTVKTNSLIVKRKGFNVNKQDPYGKKAEQDVNVTNGTSMVGVNISQDGKITVNVSRKNDNLDSTKDNYRPWTITFTVINSDDIEEDITVTHRPEIYVVGHWNENGSQNRFVNGQKTNSNKDWTNGVWGTNSYGNTNNYYLGTVNNGVAEADQNNRNLNQYKIYISVLDDASYYLGDPRKSSVDNLSNLNGLSNYHPSASTKDTNNDKPNVDKTIAPAFLIASSWGITQPVEYNQAKRRCASYQENGYPAGRWRIPTDAEIEFITGLSTKGYIPTLFQGNYWNSSGGTRSSNATGNSIYIRCVYDLWFWGDDAPLTGTAANTFTWGDQAY